MDEQKTIGARVYHDDNQYIPWEVEVPLMFNSERYDTDNIHDSEHNTRLTCRTSGIYLIIAMCIWGKIQPLTMAQLTLKLNSDMIIGTDRQYVAYSQLEEKVVWENPFNNCASIWKMEKGDYVEAIAFHRNSYVPEEYKKDKSRYPKIKRAYHLDSPEFMMHLLR